MNIQSSMNEFIRVHSYNYFAFLQLIMLHNFLLNRRRPINIFHSVYSTKYLTKNNELSRYYRYRRQYSSPFIIKNNNNYMIILLYYQQADLSASKGVIETRKGIIPFAEYIHIFDNIFFILLQRCFANLHRKIFRSSVYSRTDLFRKCIPSVNSTRI